MSKRATVEYLITKASVNKRGYNKFLEISKDVDVVISDDKIAGEKIRSRVHAYMKKVAHCRSQEESPIRRDSLYGKLSHTVVEYDSLFQVLVNENWEGV